ncbi:retrovirus-related pol polyprotein from transposon TNT 1-94 [Tanacetum coccineum]
MIVAGARETVRSRVVQQTGTQCYSCKEFGHFAKECRKPKREKDYTYHKEKMLMCKQAEKGVPLQAEQADWVDDTDEEIDEQELEAHYSFMAKIQEVLPADSRSDVESLEQVTNRTLGESNSTGDSCLIILQNKEIKIEKYKTYLNHTTEYDTLERKLKETQIVLAQKEDDIKEGLKLKAYKNSIVKKEHDELVKQILLTKLSNEGLVKEKNPVIKDLKLKEENDTDKLITMENQFKFLNEIVYKRNHSIQTIHMLAPKGSTYNGRPTFTNPMYLKKAQSAKPCLYEIPYDTSDLANRFAPDKEETLTLDQESRSKLNKDFMKCDIRQF